MSPRKVRLVVDMVRGMDVAPAIDQMKYLNKAAARPVRKLLESAVANAKHNNKIERDNLFVKAIMVNEGPTIKRWRQRAMGASAAIRKRTSHITVVLAVKNEGKLAKRSKKKAEEKSDKKRNTSKPAVKKEEKKPTTKKPSGKKKEAKKVEKKAKPVAGKAESRKAKPAGASKPSATSDKKK